MSHGVDPKWGLKPLPGVAVEGWRDYEVDLTPLEHAAQIKCFEELKQLKKELAEFFFLEEEIRKINALADKPVDESDLQEGPVLENLAKVALDSLRAASFVDFQLSQHEPTTEPRLPPVGEKPGDFCLGEANLGELQQPPQEELFDPDLPWSEL